MKGCRPLTIEEVASVAATLGAQKMGLRNQALFTLGLKTGFRVSELLSINIEDVFQHGRVTDAVYVARKAMKGKQEGRTLPLHEAARITLALYVGSLDRTAGPLFASAGGKRIGRVMVWTFLSNAFASIGMTGKLGTHCMRKTFADRIYDHPKVNGDLVKLQRALGHKWVTTTSAYVAFKDEDVLDAVLA